MTLSDYLARENISDSQFGALIDVSRQAVHRYKNGDRVPDWQVLARIRDATGGAVSPDDFLPPPAGATADAVSA